MFAKAPVEDEEVAFEVPREDTMNEAHMGYNDILWVLNNYQELSSGVWPDPRTSEDLCIKHSFLHAGWENCCLLAAEVGLRVKMCWPDGNLVEDRYGIRDGIPREYKEIVKMRWLSEDYIKERIHRVISYCSDEGIERRVGYKRWYAKNRWRKDLINPTKNVRKT